MTSQKTTPIDAGDGVPVGEVNVIRSESLGVVEVKLTLFDNTYVLSQMSFPTASEEAIERNDGRLVEDTYVELNGVVSKRIP